MEKEIKADSGNVQKYHVTFSNFKKLLYKSNIEISENILKIYSDVYEKSDLRPYLNHKEIKYLNKELLFLEKTEEILISLEKLNREKIKLNPIKAFPNNNFIFVPGPPKYHIDDKCETLYKDFSNFQIPKEIKERGSEEIENFRKFAYENKNLLNEGKEDVFKIRLKNQFRINVDIDPVFFENSGKSSIEAGTFDLDRISVEIKKIIAKIEEIRTTEEGKKSIKAYLYAPPNRTLKNQNLSDMDKELLQNKKELLEYVSKYNLYKYADKGIEYSKNLLNLYGFEPCGKCCVSFNFS